MKLFVPLLFILPLLTFAQAPSPALKSSILSAKEAAPSLYNDIRKNLTTVQSACSTLPSKVETIKKSQTRMMSKKDFMKERIMIKNMKSNINKALENEINKIDKAISAKSLCLEKLFSLDLLGFAEKEALAYLRDVQKDVKKGDFTSCASKLEKILQVGKE